MIINVFNRALVWWMMRRVYTHIHIPFDWNAAMIIVQVHRYSLDYIVYIYTIYSSFAYRRLMTADQLQSEETSCRHSPRIDESLVR
jgi:hypothetical protein